MSQGVDLGRLENTGEGLQMGLHQAAAERCRNAGTEEGEQQRCSLCSCSGWQEAQPEVLACCRNEITRSSPSLGLGARKRKACDGCAFFDSVVTERQSMENLNL